MTKKRTRTSYTMSDEGRDILGKLAGKYAITQTAMLELLIRERGKQEGLWDTDTDPLAFAKKRAHKPMDLD